jgi:Ca2+-binding EF-hand superfamily protein
MSFINNLKPESLSDNRADVERAWPMMDLNGDGLLDKREFIAIFEQTGQHITNNEVDMIFAYYDVNQDGKLNKAEFLRIIDDIEASHVVVMTKLMRPESMAVDKLQQEIDQAFLMFDTDRDGFLTKQELKIAAEMMGQKVNQEELNFVFMMIDANMDGKLSKIEMYNFAKSMEGRNSFFNSFIAKQSLAVDKI